MSDAAKCDHCRGLFEHEVGTVEVHGYNLHEADGTNTYDADGHGKWFDLCLPCSKEFLAFMRHDEPKNSHASDEGHQP